MSRGEERPISPNLFPNDPHLVLCGVVEGSVCRPSGVLMADHFIENLPWKASSQPRSTWEENASLICSLTVSSSRNDATCCSTSDPSSLPRHLTPRCESVSDSTISIPSSSADRRGSPMRQAWKWAVTRGWNSTCVCARDGQPMMCAIVSFLLD